MHTVKQAATIRNLSLAAVVGVEGSALRVVGPCAVQGIGLLPGPRDVTLPMNPTCDQESSQC